VTEGRSSFLRAWRHGSKWRLRAVLIGGLTLLAPIAATIAQSAAQDARNAAAQAPVVPKAAPGGTLTPADSLLEARTSALAAELRCPVCQGLSIQDSPSELAQQMRSVVRDQLAAGRSEREVRAYFISKYGEWILLSPRPYGFNLLAYALPAFALLAGMGFVAVKVKRWTAAPALDAPAAATATAVDDADHT